ncbi:MAG: efflux transporter outer membrane subunit [Verrucomicrobiota bacterium]|nr:efflux transporter outer membrane subunit [Verrucomicrobiota bacterium]
MGILRRWSLIVFFALSSCLSMSEEAQTRSLMAPPSLVPTIDHSLATSFFTTGDWPSNSWWEVFDSKELNDLITSALLINPSIQAVEKRVQWAKQRAIIARGPLFPLIFFNATDNWEYLSQNGLYRALNPNLALNNQQIDFTMSFSYEFDFWDKYRNLFRAALGREKAEEAESAQVKLVVTTSLAQAYFALKTNLLRKNLYERLYEVRKNIYDLQQLLVDNSLYSKLPPLFAEENMLEAKKLVFSIQEEVAVDRHLVNILAGRGPDDPLQIDEVLSSLPKTIPIPTSISLDLLACRPDLMAQIWRVESLAHEVGAAKAEFYPNINVAALAGLESGSFSNLFSWLSKTAGALPAIHLPVFTAGAIGAKVKGTKALFAQAVFEYNDLILKSFKEVADVLVFAKSIFEQKAKQGIIVASAKARYDLTLLRQVQGLDNALQNYEFQEEVIQKELEDVRLLYNQFLASIKLIKALGGGYCSPEVPLKARAHDGST